MDDNHLADQMPQTIGRYQVQESIGFGAMGAVYKAFDPLIKRTLAIKTIRLDIPKQSPQYKSFIERFYHEARISGTLSHPNIVTLFDIGEEGGLPYLAMEFVEGETIASLIDRGQRFKPEKVIGLVSQIASAVDYAHSKGVIHRDIKPSNLILYEAERVKVTDFGIAKLVDAEMTQSGTLLGTPSYMSPEQAMGDKLDGRSDIFSLGVCAFEMLSGEQPFPGNNVTSILYKLVHVDPIEPANLEMNGLVPEKWHQVFNKVLAKTPDDRYQTASEFVQDLEYCLGAWFGSAMGDDVAGETAPEGAPGDSAVPAGEEGATVMMAAAAAPVAASASSEPHEEKTILMKPPSAAKKAPASKAPVSPPAASPAAPPAADAPAEAGTTEPKTILMKAPIAPAKRPPAPAPPPSGGHEERTILMKAPPQAPVASDSTTQQATMETTQRQKPALDEGRPPSVPARPARPVPPPPPVVAPPTPDEVVPQAGPVDREPGKGPPLGLILGGVGAVLLLLVIVTGVLVYRKFAHAPAAIPTTLPAPSTTLVARVSPTPPTPPPAAPTTGTIHIESQPPGASVTVNGEPKGVTPVDLPDVALGPYQVALELRGYAPATQMVTLTAEQTRVDMSVPLSRTAPVTGTADVVSNPAGALVQIDGAAAGQTPVTPRLKIGPHKVDMTKDGYEPWSGTLTVTGQRKGRLEAQLKAIPKPPAPTATPEVVEANHVYAESEVDTPPKKLSGRSAEYPPNAPALKRGQRASVTVSFVITETGDVSDLVVAESGGPQLDEAVASAFRTWKFTPGLKHGQKVRVKVSRRHTFLGG